MFTNLNLTDMEVCYKVFRREVIQGIRLQSDRFGFEPEVTAKVARFKFPAENGCPGPAGSTRSPCPTTAGPTTRARRSVPKTEFRHSIASCVRYRRLMSRPRNTSQYFGSRDFALSMTDHDTYD